MKHSITGVDHPVLAIRDMEQARVAYERLGFIVPPRGSHPEWGTANWCIQFSETYIELRGIVVPGKESHGLGRFLEKREGLMGVSFGTLGAQVTHASLAAAGLHPRPVKPLTRNFELPEGPIPVSFNLCFLEAAETPGLMVVVICEHLTPERLRRPEWIVHPNGACQIVGLTGVSGDLSRTAKAWERLFDHVSLRHGELRTELSNNTSISLLEPELFAARYPGVQRLENELSCLLVMTLGTRDLNHTESWLKGQGIRHTAGKSILVQPRECCGTAIEFEQK